MPNQIQALKTKKNDVRAFIPHLFYKVDLRTVGRSCIAIVSKFKNVFGKNGAGFTLIEVMVVVAIMGIMAIVSIVPLGSGRIERELEANAREFASVVREAQNYALTGKKFGGASPSAFGVSWSGSTYTLDYNNGIPIALYTLKNGVTLAPASVTFIVPWANTSGGTAVLSKGGKKYFVCITSAGKVSDGITCP